MSNPNIQPLAQDFVVAAEVPDCQRYFFHDPNLTRLDDGGLLIAAPQWEREPPQVERRLRMLHSGDGGVSWEELPVLPFDEGTPFLLDGRLLMFVQEESHKDFQIVASEDGGRTWTDPVTLIEGPVWNISTAMLRRSDALYWAMDYDVDGLPHDSKVMVRMDRSMSPLDPGAWSTSNVVPPPELPPGLTRGMFAGGSEFPFQNNWFVRDLVWLEPNTVDVNGHIRVFVRCVIDHCTTSGMAAALDYDPGEQLLRFTQFTPWPGGQCKFFIIHDQSDRTDRTPGTDQTAGMYWMLSNLVTNSQDYLDWGSCLGTAYHGGPGNERRWMFLHYSVDCLNWFPAGCVARWPDSIRHSFMYPSAVVDGNDLVILSRSSRDSGDQHDADLCTIHRVRDFRSLAMDLRAGNLDASETCSE